MDALSSQANLAGYKAVLLAAVQLPKMFPMMTTAAGPIAPAKVLVLGAGVANSSLRHRPPFGGSGGGF
jgi:NAD(P) transhydrogenase subunit alpha